MRGPVAVLAAAALALTACGSSRPPLAAGTHPIPFDFTTPALDGPGRVRLTDFRGAPVVVNFFASWCGACLSELPGFVDEARALKGRVAFVGIDTKETGDPQAMPRRFDLAHVFAALGRDTGPDVLLEGPDALNSRLGGGVPLTAFFSPDGMLLRAHAGRLTAAQLRDQLHGLYGV